MGEYEKEKIVKMRRWKEESQVFCVFNFSSQKTKVSVSFPAGNWQRLIDSSESIWSGPGSIIPQELDSDRFISINAFSFVLFIKSAF